MDPSFQEVMESLGATLDKTREQHRSAMTEANVPLATLGRDHSHAMEDAVSKLGSLNHHEQDTAENSERLHRHVGEYNREMAEADRRLSTLSTLSSESEHSHSEGQKK